MQNKSGGFALMTAVILLVLFTTLGLSGVSLFSTDTHIAWDTLSSAQALFLAEAGMQYALENLSHDSDWSDNTDVSKSMAGGTFNIHYISKTPDTASVSFTGTRGNVSRKFTVNLVKQLLSLDYAAYVSGDMHTQGATNLTITGKVQTEAANLPTVNLAYYEGIADHKIYTNQTFNAGTYSGIWYVAGSVTIDSNVTINGTVIATGNLSMKGSSNITITPSLPYPALIANGNFQFQNSNNITINGLIYVGADMNGNFLLQSAQNFTVIGTVIVAGNFNLQQSDSVTITYRSQGALPGFSGPGVPVYNTWQEAA